ncbi:MAG: hypothetical protein MPJ24_11395 [Pirellulaceae bacterium]|nr:hypothetical protein [Pirellulaceae bacterium]
MSEKKRFQLHFPNATSLPFPKIAFCSQRRFFKGRFSQKVDKKSFTAKKGQTYGARFVFVATENNKSTAPKIRIHRPAQDRHDAPQRSEGQHHDQPQLKIYRPDGPEATSQRQPKPQLRIFKG